MNWLASKSLKLVLNLIVAVLMSFIIPVYFSPDSEILANVSPERLLLYSLWFGICFLFCGELMGISDRGLRVFSVSSLISFLMGALISAMLLLLSIWLVEYEFVGRLAILKISFSTGFICFWLAVIQDLLSKRNPTKCILLVPDEKRKALLNALDENQDTFAWIEAEYDQEEDFLLRVCKTEGVDLLVLDESDFQRKIDILSFLSLGTQVMGSLEFWQRFVQRIPPREVDQAWLAKLDLRMRDPLVHNLKRVFDCTFGFLGLLFASPLLTGAVILIAIESGFPLFFSQSRTGYLGRTFTIFKIRTMKRNAEKEVGAEWAKTKDHRVTKFGSFLRKWRIDEIPQFWNVIKGDMSIVGPRPERPEFQSDLSSRIPHWNSRHLVKPGLTGWAQVRFRYASDVEASEEKLSYDLYYLKNLSFVLDLEIILSTLRSIKKGSR